SLVAPLLLLAHKVAEAVQLGLAERLGLDHAADQLFNRTLAETIDDLAHGARREASRRFRRRVEIRAAFRLVTEISLLLQSSQQGSNRGLLQVAVLRDLVIHGLD